jgi:carbamoyl-phosphate synthase large subunit
MQRKIVKNKINVLISCSSRESLILKWVKLSLNQFSISNKIYLGDNNKNVVSKYFGENFWHMPKIKNINFKKILKFCLRNKINIVIPTSDFELEFWAKYKNTFKINGIFVMVSDISTVKLCRDKFKFLHFLKANGFKSPETFSEIKKIKYKNNLVLKERYGAGSKNCFLNIKYKYALKKYKDLTEPIFQKFISGKELSIDCYVDSEKKIYDILIRKRDSVNNGESELTTAIKNHAVKKIILKLINHFKFDGHIMFQGILRKGKFYIIECNPRIGGASILSSFFGEDSITKFISKNLLIKPYKNKKTSKVKKILIYKEIKLIR